MASVLTASLQRSMSRAGKREGLSVKLKIKLKSIHCMQEGDQSCTTITGGCNPSTSLRFLFVCLFQNILRDICLFVFQPLPPNKW